MNAQPESDALRTDIEQTRRRMDDTVDELGNRLQPRHIVDELVGLFRRNADSPKIRQAKEKISQGAKQSINAVVDTVKENPIPAVLIGAGVAWLIYEATRDKTEDRSDDDDDVRYDPDLHYDRPLEYPSSLQQSGQSQFSDLKDTVAEKASDWGDAAKEKAGEWKDAAKDKMSEMGDKMDTLRERAGEKWESAKGAAAEKLQAAKERAGQIGAQVKEGAQRAYQTTRKTVVRTADEHPLELGLGCLAVGVIAGLLIPTPDPVHRIAGPTADRLRERTKAAGRDLVDKGKRVAQAAATAAKEEADAQGLTPDRLREKATAVAESAADATTEAARREGLAPGDDGHENSGSAPSDPSVARPEK